MNPQGESPSTSTLVLKGLILNTVLGVYPEERRKAQEVEFDFFVYFSKVPKGCVTDELSQTVCYSDISQWAMAVCDRKPYFLIEHLAYEVGRELSLRLAGQAERIKVSVKKFQPPMEYRLREACFEIEFR